MQKNFRIFGAALAAAILIPGLALAGHGKAGLWQMTVTMDMPGMQMPQMPDMSNMPPEMQARMKAIQMQMSGHSLTVQHCMTPQEVAMDKPDLSRMQRNKDCAMSDVTMTGHSFSANMTCKGADFAGVGQMRVAFDSDEHYSGESSVTGTMHGHPMNMHETFDGKWISADCGSLPH